MPITMHSPKLIVGLVLALSISFVSCRQICPEPEIPSSATDSIAQNPLPQDTLSQDTLSQDTLSQDTLSSVLPLFIGDYTEDLSAAAASPFDLVRNGIRVGQKLDSMEGVDYLLLEYTDTTSATDYHYLPACWRNIPAGQPLADTVYAYTKRTLASVPTASVQYVQIGRDISHGLLWHTVDDQLSLTKPMSDYPTAWQNQALYIKAAIRATRECCPHAKIVLQTSKLGSTQSLHEQLPRLLTNWVELGIDYEVLSFYVAPAIRSSLADFESGLTSLFNSQQLSTLNSQLSTLEFHFETFYPCSSDIPEEVFVRSASKVGYPYTPAGQHQYLHDWKNIITTSLALLGRRRSCFIYRHPTSPAYFRLYDYQYFY